MTQENIILVLADIVQEVLNTMKKTNSLSTKKFPHFPPSHCLPIPPWGWNDDESSPFFLESCLCVFANFDFKFCLNNWSKRTSSYVFSQSSSQKSCSLLSILTHSRNYLWYREDKSILLQQQYSKISCQASYRILVYLCLAFDRIWSSTKFLRKTCLKFKVR